MSSLGEASACSLSRAQGCLVGQIAGDALGSLVEFESGAYIEHLYPDGVRLLRDGGTWNTIAGQPTDDSELALALARSLVLRGRYDVEAVAQSYVKWYESEPFDMGQTIEAALSAAAADDKAIASLAAAARRAANRSSQANGALMRISPLGIFGSQITEQELAECARADASLTHPHAACQDANVVFAGVIAFAIRTCAPPDGIYNHALETIKAHGIGTAVSRCLKDAKSDTPADYQTQQGWVLIALQNAFYQLLHAPNMEEGIVDTVRRGGDTDTNAAITGALLGAAWGLEAVPSQWLECVLSCRPEEGKENVQRPRPKEYWPVDVLTLAARLLGGSTFSG